MQLGQRGLSAMEFALWGPVLILLLFGGFDLANQAQTAIRLEHAVRAGAQVAFANPADTTTIRQAVLNAFPGLTTAEVTVACFCGTVEQACTATCAATQVHSVRIGAARTLVPLLLGSANRAEGNATVRPG